MPYSVPIKLSAKGKKLKKHTVCHNWAYLQ